MTTNTTTQQPINAGEVIVIDAHLIDAVSFALALATNHTANKVVAVHHEHLMNMTPSGFFTISHPRLAKQPLAAIAHLEHEDAGALLQAVCRYHQAGALVVDALHWRQAVALNESLAIAGIRNLKFVAGMMGIPVLLISDMPILRILADAFIDRDGNTLRRLTIATHEVESFKVPAIAA